MSTDPRKGTKAGSGNTQKQPDYDYDDYEQSDSYYNNGSEGKYVPSEYTQVKQSNLKKTTPNTGGSTAYSKMYDSGDYDDTEPSDSYYTAAGDYTQSTNYSQMQQGIPQTKQTSTNNSTTEKKTSGKKQ